MANRDGRHYRRKAFNRWYVYVGILVVATLIGEFGRTNFIRSYVQTFKIPSGTMIPTLLVGDHIYIDKNTQHRWANPALGEVIVIKFPEDETKDFIKRVIGMPGDIVEIQNKKVLINSVPLDGESYTQRIDLGILDGSINPRDNNLEYFLL